MIERARIETLIRSGVRAPSGDNSQPWSFAINGDALNVYIHPERDHPVLNVKNRGTYISLGALIENLIVAAGEGGLNCDVRLFSGGAAAYLAFKQSDTSGHHLYGAIEKRHTHRGPYHTALSAEHLFALTPPAEPHCTITAVTDPSSIRRIGDAVSMMEEVALKTQKLHRGFFESIMWSEKENRTGGKGLYIKTTELPLPVQWIFRLLRYWPVMRAFNAVGFPRLAAKSNAAVYRQSGAYVAILLNRTEPQDFVAAGRCMQRVWLEATHRGLAAQPLAGLLYLREYVRENPDPDISPTLRRRILNAGNSIDAAVGVRNTYIAMLMRVGEAHRPASAKTHRTMPHII